MMIGINVYDIVKIQLKLGPEESLEDNPYQVYNPHSYILRVVLVIIMEFHWFIGRIL